MIWRYSRSMKKAAARGLHGAVGGRAVRRVEPRSQSGKAGAHVGGRSRGAPSGVGNSGDPHEKRRLLERGIRGCVRRQTAHALPEAQPSRFNEPASHRPAALDHAGSDGVRQCDQRRSRPNTSRNARRSRMTGAEFPLPRRAQPGSAHIAGAGWQIVMYFPELSDFGIFNLATGKMDGFIECDELGPLFAAGGGTFVVYTPSTQTFHIPTTLPRSRRLLQRRSISPEHVAFVGMGLLNFHARLLPSLRGQFRHSLGGVFDSPGVRTRRFALGFDPLPPMYRSAAAVLPTRPRRLHERIRLGLRGHDPRSLPGRASTISPHRRPSRIHVDYAALPAWENRGSVETTRFSSDQG